MEKTAIFSKVPRPPKQIWEVEKPIEAVEENPVVAEENKERFSAITVMHPKKDVAENKNLAHDNEQELDIASETKEDLEDGKNIKGEAETLTQNEVSEQNGSLETEGMGDENDIDELVAEPETTIEPKDNKGSEEEKVPENGIGFEPETFLDKNKSEDKIDVEVEENTTSENSDEAAIVAATDVENNLEADKNEEGENDNDLEQTIASALEVEENELFEKAIELEPIAVPQLKTEPDIENEAVESERNVATTAAAPQKTTRVPEQVQGEIKIPNDMELYKRQYYTMGEVATMFNVNQSLIRFWENEFAILQPKKNKKGDRYFRPEDVKNLQLIHHLLRSRKFTIEGANEYLKNNKQRATDTVAAVESLQQLKSFLIELKANL